MKISLVTVQMTSAPSVEKNLRWLGEQLNQFNKTLPTLVVLPECFACFGGNENAQLTVAEEFGQGAIQHFIANQAKKKGVWILAGSMPLKSKQNNKILAASLLFSPDGSCVAHYNKMHLFDVEVADSTRHYHESATTEAGEQIVVVDTELGRIGLSICYDLRFAELYRAMQAQGADIICVPSAFTQLTGAAHWQPLVQARAIENQVFMVAANQTGQHENGRQTYGHSMVVDPWGEILHCQKMATGLAESTVELNRLNEIRAKMPNLKHRKLF
ncbi:carbon-nitrogen hydrolase family protein [Gayadomonas joobiniege]|uniref:carbon-nitrogen hydrolase family protein n=1 Tax=Gayadomonas joobiniege TaxID=1234606 RepID=UPI0003826B9D|nr:carbon-nitrogen hydrolase family protein [Gayadomonas joobiniege]